MGNKKTSGLDWCGTNVLGGEQTAVAMPPNSARLTRTAFPVGLKSIAASQSSASNSCFVSCLKSWGPEPHKLPSLCRRIEGRVQPIVSIHFVIKNQRQSKQGGAGCGQARKALHCWGVRTIQLIQQQEEHGRDVILQTNASGLIHSLIRSLTYSSDVHFRYKLDHRPLSQNHTHKHISIAKQKIKVFTKSLRKSSKTEIELVRSGEKRLKV